MKYKHIFFISPPFYSHFNPLLVMAKSFKDQGVKVTFGCSIDFKEQILDADLNFYEIDISKNKNVGSPGDTIQPEGEKLRLEEFFQATRKGAIETLITQSHHRKADMLYDPQELIYNIRTIDDLLDVDLYLVDILSYSVSLSLYFLGLDFITFCPPHPYTIPKDEVQYGVPKNWPAGIDIKKEDLNRLKKVAKNTEEEFTQVFNKIIDKNKDIERVENAFNLVSDIGIIYNYFDFNNIESRQEDPREIFIGNCFEEKALDESWLKILDTREKKIMITLGTFLSNRRDVLEKLISYTREIYPQALLIVSTGENAEKLKDFRSEKTIIKDFLPQIGLMPHMDLVIFHGGCNTFTESMYYGNDMIVLPFSSDQFNIGYDVEKNNLGRVIDPNDFSKKDLSEAFNDLKAMPKDQLKYWSKVSKERGGDYAAKIILEE